MSLLGLLCFLYVTPLLRVAVKIILVLGWSLQYPVKKILGKPLPFPRFEIARNFLGRVNLLLGNYEYYIRGLRDAFVGLSLLVYLVFGSHRFFPLLFLALIFYIYHHQMLVSLKVTELLRAHPGISPSTFFKRLKHWLGPFPLDLPDGNLEPALTPTHLSFKKHVRSRQSILPLLCAIWDTGYLAHMTIRAWKHVGIQYARDVVDAIGAMWGKRILELMSGSLEVTGEENLANLKGKIILVINHKSQLDFALLFFALSQIRLGSGRILHPRFILAKDHFMDNPFVYDILGVGRAVEAVDMIFIDRKKTERGFEGLKKAAQTLVDKDIDIVIFPQGTRAEGNLDRSEKRRDAGYYTTIRPSDIDSDLGHLRKGLAHLTVDTLTALPPGVELNLVFVAVSGTGVALPKKSLTLQTECDIRFDIAAPLTLTREMADGVSNLVSHIHEQIDRHLVNILGIHENLQYRFMLDLKGYFRFTRERIQMVSDHFEKISAESPVVFQILDRLYACPPKDWNPYLSELAQLLMDQSSISRLKDLRAQVSIRMLESWGKKKVEKPAALPHQSVVPIKKTNQL